MTHATAEAHVAGRSVYYGWVVLAVAALAMVGTLPGRTQGLGLITEPLLRDVAIDRIRFAQINLIATLAGSVFCVGIGGLVDRYGSRIVLTSLAVLLGAVVTAMSSVQSGVMLLVLITLTRGVGQSALSVVSLAMPGKWFRRRLTSAMAVYSLVMSVGFMIAFPTVGALVLARGWRVAWAAVGAALILGLAPLAWLIVQREPEAGRELDIPDPDRPGSPATDSTLSAALRSPAFWVFGIASALYGLVASGIGLFNESILAERGFPPTVYHSALAVTAMTGLAGNIAAGAWAGRGGLRPVLVAALVLLASALVALPHVSTVPHVMLQAVAMGAAGGFLMVVFFSFWGRAYGRTHLGRIQGVAQALTVVFSAIGPLLLAWCVETTGSYAVAFRALALTVGALTAAALMVRVPPGAEDAGAA
ncbi:MAG TPA: MFS transporter [Vicinamibacterales bacterium]|nr:MFS transporter [Vicinamibacterales bacterium]